jgi:hypothetical protein
MYFEMKGASCFLLKVDTTKWKSESSLSYFVTDRVEQGDVKIEHKPTGEMWIDMNTKPKQGTPFRTDRSHMMNCPLNVMDRRYYHFPPRFYELVKIVGVCWESLPS